MISSLAAIKEHVSTNDADLRDSYFSLEAMAVSKARRGAGIGTRVLKQLLGKADVAQKPVLLLTQKESNVKFYSRLGFTSKHDVQSHLTQLGATQKPHA